MAAAMSSKERVLAAVRSRPTDHLPLCFEGVCHGAPRFLEEAFPDPFDRTRYYLDREIDTAVHCSPPPISQQGFETCQWVERPTGEPHPILYKEYRTPAGSLRQVARKTDDYPDEIHLFSDHNVPAGRSLRYLISGTRDLAALRYILQPPSDAELEAYLDRARQTRAFCRRHGVLFATYLLGIGDPLIWLSGVESVLLAAFDDPAFLQEYVEIVARWNRRLLEIAIEAGCEHVVRRGWYESTDFWSPRLYRQYLLEPVKQEVALAHQAGLTFAYVMNSGAMPLLSVMLEAGVDMLSNVDPLTPGTDLKRMKQKLWPRVAMCGGVNNNHVLEMGSEEEVRAAVHAAAQTLGPGGGYIMAPGDALGYIETTDTVKRNFEVMVDAWRAIR